MLKPTYNSTVYDTLSIVLCPVCKGEIKIRHVKINKINKQYNSLSATELKKLVKGAQRFEQQAIDRLCQLFKPLVLREAYKSYIVGTLGDDAQNTAWEIFLEFIHNYHGNKYRLLPGLIQMHLSFKLMHKVYPKRNTNVKAEAILDAVDSNGSKLLDPSDEHACINKFFENKFFEGIYAHLTPKQSDIIDAVYRHNMDLKKYSEEQNISYTAAYQLKNRALDILKNVVTYE